MTLALSKRIIDAVIEKKDSRVNKAEAKPPAPARIMLGYSPVKGEKRFAPS